MMMAGHWWLFLGIFICFGIAVLAVVLLVVLLRQPRRN